MIFSHLCRSSCNKLSSTGGILLIAFTFTLVAGCQDFTMQSDFMNILKQQSQNEFQMTPGQLRAQLNDISDAFEGMIEDGADDIMAGSDDPAVRKQALLWKANAIPIIHDTLFHSDPLVAIIDTKAFILQMIQYFETGPGKTAFGPWHETALAVCRDMDEIVKEIGRQLVGDEEERDFYDRLMEWVKNNPITSPNFYRASLTAEIAYIIGDKSVNTFKAMGNLALGMNDIAARLNVYSRHLPKQARWQAELLIYDELPPDSARIVLGQLMVLTESAVRITDVVERSPELIAKEREIILEKVEMERIQVLDALRGEHALARKWLSGERKIVLDAIEARVHGVEKEVRDIIASERRALLSEVDAMGEQRIIDAIDYSEQMINRLLLKVGLACLACFLCVAALLWALTRKALRRVDSGGCGEK